MPRGDLERGFDRVTSVAVLVGVVATIIAGATIWLVLTDLMTVANSWTGARFRRSCAALPR